MDDANYYTGCSSRPKERLGATLWLRSRIYGAVSRRKYAVGVWRMCKRLGSVARYCHPEKVGLEAGLPAPGSLARTKCSSWLHRAVGNRTDFVSYGLHTRCLKHIPPAQSQWSSLPEFRLFSSNGVQSSVCACALMASDHDIRTYSILHGNGPPRYIWPPSFPKQL